MTCVAITCTIGVYGLYIVEAVKSYKKGEKIQRPKPWLRD